VELIHIDENTIINPLLITSIELREGAFVVTVRDKTFTIDPNKEIFLALNKAGVSLANQFTAV
jgi:hypothetical protein